MPDPDKNQPLSDGEIHMWRMKCRRPVDDDTKEDPIYTYWIPRFFATFDHCQQNLRAAQNEIENLRSSVLELAAEVKRLRKQ